MAGILITGAARRLGAGMARHLAAKGQHVVVNYHSSREDADALVADIRRDDGVAFALQADLTDREQMMTLIERAADAAGEPISVLINNASIFDFDRVDDDPSVDNFDIWDKNIKTNLEAPYFLTQAMAAQTDQGQVINMIDQRVLRLTPNFGSYTLAKSALWTMTRTAAQALAPRIRVNAIGPGTTLQGAHQDDENFAHHRKISILQQGADMDDILAAVDYLMGAAKVTGQMIAVDGGQHLIWELPK